VPSARLRRRRLIDRQLAAALAAAAKLYRSGPFPKASRARLSASVDAARVRRRRHHGHQRLGSKVQQDFHRLNPKGARGRAQALEGGKASSAISTAGNFSTRSSTW